MKKNKKLLVSSLFLIASSLYSNEIDANLKKIEHSLSFKFVDVSKTDVNRIVCENGEIGKIVYSKDKELTIQKDGENAFVKLSPVTTRSNGIIVDTIVNDFIRDIYIECNKKIYSLNLTPKDISAQTILLFDNNTKKDNQEAKRFEKSNSFEKTLIDIIKSIYKEKEPDGYISKLLPPKTIKFSELELTPTKTYSGNDYFVYEYRIKALKDLDLDEKMFINFVASNPLALALTQLNIEKNKEARLFVISNASPDPISIEEKTNNYFKSLEELKIDEENIKKETSHVISPNESIETNIKDTSNEILDEEWMK